MAAWIGIASLLVAACSATSMTSSQPTASAPSAAPATPTLPAGYVAIREGPAPAGKYSTTSFRPTVMFTIPSDGWRFFFQDDEDELTAGTSEIELTGGRVANVLDPVTHAITPAPDDLVAWLGSHPGLDSGSPGPATVGGIAGQSIDVTNTGSANVDIFAYPTGNLRVAAGTTARIWVLPYDGPDLVFSGFARTTTFQQALPILQAIIDSIVIGPG
jgi:hypothetical protein